MQRSIQTLKVRVCLIAVTALFGLITITGWGEMVLAADCSGNTCPMSCDDFATVMEARQPFYYAGEFEAVCVEILNGEGIRVRQEGSSTESIIVLTTKSPFPFVSEWVGRRVRNPVAWRFEKYGF